MADVSVEFGAKDTGLQKTLQTVQNELTSLKKDLSDGSLSFDELNQAMRKVAQAERLESQLQRIANETEQAGNEAVGAANDFDKLDREMDQVAANSGTTGVSIGQLRSAFTKITGVIASVTAALQSMRVAFNYAQDGVQLAMGLEETMNRVGEIFGSSAMQIEQWSQGSVRGLAMTEEQAMSAASEFAIFGRSAGLAGDDLVGFSTRLTRLATDIASFNNAEPEEGVRAIGAALRGESEPIRRFGVLLDEATLKNRALQMGLIETTTGALTPQQRVLAAYNEILAQTTTQQGDFARTAEGAANQTKILSASLTQIQTDIGSGLLPAWESFIGYLNTVAVPGLETVVNKLGELATGSSEAAESLGLTGEDAANFGQMLFRASGAINPFLGALNQTDGVLRLLAGSAEDAADKANQTSAEIESLGRMMDAASGQTMTLTNSMNGLGTGGTFTNVNSEAEKFSGLLGDSSIKLNSIDAALGTMNPKLTEQNALYGKIDTTLGNSQVQLSAQLSIIDSTIRKQNTGNKILEERTRILRDQQRKSLEQYETEIQINNALAAGNEELANQLTYQQDLKELTDRIAKETGLAADEAARLAREFLASRDAADEAAKSVRSIPAPPPAAAPPPARGGGFGGGRGGGRADAGDMRQPPPEAGMMAEIEAARRAKAIDPLAFTETRQDQSIQAQYQEALAQGRLGQAKILAEKARRRGERFDIRERITKEVGGGEPLNFKEMQDAAVEMAKELEGGQSEFGRWSDIMGMSRNRLEDYIDGMLDQIEEEKAKRDLEESKPPTAEPPADKRPTPPTEEPTAGAMSLADVVTELQAIKDKLPMQALA